MRITSLFSRSRVGAPPDKFAELAKLEVGLKVVHTPVRVAADAGGRSGFNFTWTYQTSVMSIEGWLALEEFGGFIWDGRKWVFSNVSKKPFTPREFAEWYECRDAFLAPGREYFDRNNWSGAATLRGFRMKWYYIAAAADGRLVKGEADVELLPILRPE